MAGPSPRTRPQDASETAIPLGQDSRTSVSQTNESRTPASLTLWAKQWDIGVTATVARAAGHQLLCRRDRVQDTGKAPAVDDNAGGFAAVVLAVGR